MCYFGTTAPLESLSEPYDEFIVNVMLIIQTFIHAGVLAPRRSSPIA